MHYDDATAVVRVDGDTVALDVSRTWLDLTADEAQRLADVLALAADEAHGNTPFSLAALRAQLGLSDISNEELTAGLDRLADAVLGEGDS